MVGQGLGLAIGPLTGAALHQLLPQMPFLAAAVLLMIAYLRPSRRGDLQPTSALFVGLEAPGQLGMSLDRALGACVASVLSHAIARDLFDGEALARALDGLLSWRRPRYGTAMPGTGAAHLPLRLNRIGGSVETETPGLTRRNLD